MHKLCGYGAIRACRRQSAGDRRRCFSDGGRAGIGTFGKSRIGARAGISHKAEEGAGSPAAFFHSPTMPPVSKTAGAFLRIHERLGQNGKAAGRRRRFFHLSAAQSFFSHALGQKRKKSLYGVDKEGDDVHCQDSVGACAGAAFQAQDFHAFLFQTAGICIP